MKQPTFQVRHIRWWHKPIPLLLKIPGEIRYRRIGWVWNQWAYVVNNLYEGLIAFVDDQTPEKIDHWKCENCGAAILGEQREKIEESSINFR